MADTDPISLLRELPANATNGEALVRVAGMRRLSPAGRRFPTMGAFHDTGAQEPGLWAPKQCRMCRASQHRGLLALPGRRSAGNGLRSPRRWFVRHFRLLLGRRFSGCAIGWAQCVLRLILVILLL